MSDDDRRGLEAAFHHAGHAVAAHLSKYHALAQPLRLDAWGGGEVTASLSRRKLIAADKVATAAARVDPEVAESIATILCAGLASERIACERHRPLKLDPARSSGDLDMARSELRGAGLPEDTAPHEAAAAEVLELHWDDVETIAQRLAVAEELTPAEIAELLATP